VYVTSLTAVMPKLFRCDVLSLYLATDHPDIGFSWFPCVYEYKRMLRWFPSFQVATTCYSRNPPDLNFLVTYLIFE